MAGLLIGAFWDRAYEAGQRKSWATALVFGLAGLGAWFGVALFVHRTIQGPDPDDLARDVRTLLVREWRKRPAMEGAKIQSVSLVRTRNMEYSGLVDAMKEGQRIRFHITVKVEGQDFFVDWIPVD
jgi:hypothetical protein